ncbi:MAG: hypothetical protein JWM39_651 [Parcubacteria group bacterium]|nr:hypothetical protein [Parcubacteria group bacterium]
MPAAAALLDELAEVARDRLRRVVGEGGARVESARAAQRSLAGQVAAAVMARILTRHAGVVATIYISLIMH